MDLLTPTRLRWAWLLVAVLAACTPGAPADTTRVCGGQGQVCCVPPATSVDGGIGDVPTLPPGVTQSRMDGGAITTACDPALACVPAGGLPRCEPCPMGQVVCGGACVALADDPNNCGACGTTCPIGSLGCRSSTCVFDCTFGMTVCNGLCKDLNSDPANCGACGNACAPGQICGSSVCTCPSTASTQCGSGTTAMCVNTMTDPANCGHCGTVCPAGTICTAGVCATSCPMGEAVCAGSCTTLSSDPTNCGACGNACAPGQSCTAGACSCSGTNILCSGACVSPSNDPANCGSCGTVCSNINGTGVCVSGACRTLCNTGFGDCDGMASNGCETTLSNTANDCGTCGTACPTPAHTTGAVCTTGTCGYLACSPGWGDCDGLVSNGCETSLTTNSNCGRCGTVCSEGIPPGNTCVVTGTSGACEQCGSPGRPCCTGVGGACEAGTTCTGSTCGCPVGQTLCPGVGVGTCRNLSDTPADCGSCTTVCATGSSCAAGICCGIIGLPCCNGTTCTSGFCASFDGGLRCIL